VVSAWLLFLAAAQLGWAGDKGWAWKTTTSPHFEVSHEEAFLPPAFLINLEKIHSRLRMDLAMFSPWMAKERLKLFLYRDQASYLAGEFSPPSWSNGVAQFDRKAVAVPNQLDRRKLLQVIGHETTHLLFEGYWREAGKSAPSWLEEGLAMLEEDDPREYSQWLEAMAWTPSENIMAMEEFLEVSLSKDLHNKASVSRWYVQSYSVVRFLYRNHSRLQFKMFCSSLRDGQTVREALWLVYRYGSLRKFETAWRRWLSDPSHKKQAQTARAAYEGGGEKPAPRKRSFSFQDITPMSGFRSLRDGPP
jgi:hypothetical protein